MTFGPFGPFADAQVAYRREQILAQYRPKPRRPRKSHVWRRQPRATTDGPGAA
jgi:hypothetical protein